MSTPSSIINICSGVRLNSKYEHTIYFANASAQLSYFAGKVVKTFSAYSYLRKSWNIKVDATMEQAKTWSYMYFQNGTGKYYFYFINNIEYINDSTVELSLELDVMQTYMFDYSLLECFVEREHTSTDNIGEHIVEEGIDVGDIRVVSEEPVSELIDLCVLVMATYNPATTTAENRDIVLSANYNGVFSGLGIYAVNVSDWKTWGEKLKFLDEEGMSDGIVAMWMYPKELVALGSGDSWESHKVPMPAIGVSYLSKTVRRNDNTSGSYTPRNKKLLTYPYNFLYLTNNTGGSAVYRYERFGDPLNCSFKIVGSLSPDGNVKIYPLNYNGASHNYDEGVLLSGFPSCAWNQDVYKLWLAQNQNQQNLALGVAGLKIAGGVVGAVSTGGIGAVMGVSTIASGAMDIANILAQRADKEIQPPQAKGNHSTSVNVVNGWQTFTLQRKSLGVEQAKILDDYFDMYGYKVNTVKTPNRKARQNWTYTKTIGCHINGNLCNEDIAKIESIYNNGVTFWANGDSIGNYSLSNNTI